MRAEKELKLKRLATNETLPKMIPITLLLTVTLSSLLIASEVAARPGTEKNYLRIEQNKIDETDDLTITSLGQLVFKQDMMGHVELSQLKSDINGKAYSLEFGGGYVYNWDISLFFGLGIALGYNSDKDDYIAAYFPEAGAVIDITNTFGITANVKRYHNLYEQEDVIVMLGLVFRN